MCCTFAVSQTNVLSPLQLMSRGVFPNSNMGRESPDKVVRPRVVPATGVMAIQSPNRHRPLPCPRQACSTLLLLDVPPSVSSTEGSDAETNTQETDLSQNNRLSTDVCDGGGTMHCARKGSPMTVRKKKGSTSGGSRR